ncbi:MAG: D-alanine--D-alanine ligase [Candidatus Moranbacteria bacterium]|nr:D-alanine--D-alanine ligase [Candidatus Moranbacteria bacterium]
MKKIKIALLFGGISGEREVSLKTGEKICAALDKNKYTVEKYDPKTDLEKFFIKASRHEFDLIFPALHGPFGEDGKLQGLLDMLGIPYVFSGTLASALAMHKPLTKIIAKNAGLILAKDVLLKKEEKYNLNLIIKKLAFPIVVKPAELGSSVGTSIAKNLQELKKSIKDAFQYGREILLEEYIQGRELTVVVMGNNPPKALLVIEIIPQVSAWFDYRAKYAEGGSAEICPADIPRKIAKKIQEDSVKIFKKLGCADLARADFIWSAKNKKIYFLEINTIPGMTAQSLAPKVAKTMGLEFGEFLDKLIEGALKRK